jgi:hypothetical protein
MEIKQDVIDRIAVKPDDEPLTETELEQMFIFEFGEPFETYDDGTPV